MMNYLENLNEKNCNARLTKLYKERDNISIQIDKLIGKGLDTSSAEKKYDDICDIIDKLIRFRRQHKCLLENDEGYTLY